MVNLLKALPALNHGVFVQTLRKPNLNKIFITALTGSPFIGAAIARLKNFWS